MINRTSLACGEGAAMAETRKARSLLAADVDAERGRLGYDVEKLYLDHVAGFGVLDEHRAGWTRSRSPRAIPIRSRCGSRHRCNVEWHLPMRRPKSCCRQ